LGPSVSLRMENKRTRYKLTVGWLADCEILEDGDADVVFAAREFLRDPNFALKAASELHVDVKWPVQYHRATYHVPHIHQCHEQQNPHYCREEHKLQKQ
jgi:hypothetical protein